MSTCYRRGLQDRPGNAPVSERSDPSVLRAFDQFDPVRIRIANEAEQGAAFAYPVGLPLGLDPLASQPLEGGSEIVDADRNVAVGGAELVAPAVVIEGELELLLLAGRAEEVVRRL